jgi:phosphoribosyl-ATP pyrophosphohydrolase
MVMDNICDYQLALRDFQIAVANKMQPSGLWTPKPFVPNDYMAQLREKLIMEEAEEVSEELIDGTKAGLAKELADLLYVVFGTAAEYNIPLWDVFLRVHVNNLLKIKNSHFNDFGKLVKPKDHPKVDLSDIVGD